MNYPAICPVFIKNMIVSFNLSLGLFLSYRLTSADPERIAAQVVSGIGFLGAGTALK